MRDGLASSAIANYVISPAYLSSERSHVSMNDRRQRLIDVLREAREFLARPDNDFAWSSWEDAAAALREIDGIVSRIESGDMPKRSDIELLFLPTGWIQEVSVSSGWGREFVELASRFDAAIESAYGVEVFVQLARLLPESWKLK